MEPCKIDLHKSQTHKPGVRLFFHIVFSNSELAGSSTNLIDVKSWWQPDFAVVVGLLGELYVKIREVVLPISITSE